MTNEIKPRTEEFLNQMTFFSSEMKTKKKNLSIFKLK